ncbi:MAG: hypothetical protein GY820_13435 [Gammaproteobacteria bacterium]|nr:hypothetical protein [Gammaproteobacteria bacterium]
MRRSERSLTGLPRPLLIGFVLILSIQIITQRQADMQRVDSYRPLSNPLSVPIYAGLSMASDKLLSYLLVLRLQLHDNQAGRHVRYDNIDYTTLVEWLSKINQLNPDSEYPMLLASRVYSQTKHKSRLRLLLGFIDQTFTKNPQLHWRRQTEATVIAKHQLGDLPLALAMAQKLADQAGSVKMPRWARDMHFLLLGDLNEFETGIIIVQGLLKDGQVTDPDEISFLREKLLYFQQKLSEFGQKS